MTSSTHSPTRRLFPLNKAPSPLRPGAASSANRLRAGSTSNSMSPSSSPASGSSPLLSASPGRSSRSPSAGVAAQQQQQQQQQQGGMDEDKLKKYKTQMCQRLSSDEGCRFGASCDFAHSPDELRRSLTSCYYVPILCTIKGCRDPECQFSHNLAESQYHPDVYKTKLCTYWNNDGTCQRGAYCSFAHGMSELRSKKKDSYPHKDRVGASLNSPMKELSLSGDMRTTTSTHEFGYHTHINSSTSAVSTTHLRHQQAQQRRYSADGYENKDRDRSSSTYGAAVRSSTIQKRTTTAAAGGAEVDNNEAIKQRLLSLLDEAEQSGNNVHKQRASNKDREESFSLLTGDLARLGLYTLRDLTSLQQYQQEMLAITTDTIQTYEESHPSATCRVCETASVDTVLFPCHHAVVCEACGNECEECPLDECGENVDRAKKMAEQLPQSIRQHHQQAQQQLRQLTQQQQQEE